MKAKTPLPPKMTHDLYMTAGCKLCELPKPTKEHKFAKERKFRFDYAWLDTKLAVEIEGGIWIQGRHTRGSGYKKDMEKYNLATKYGWRILRFTPQELKKEETYIFIKECLENCL